MPHDTSSSEEVVVRLLQEETPITIKIHGDYLKLVEKKERIRKEPIPEIKVTTSEEIMTDLDKMISFDDDFDSEEELADYESETVKQYSDDEEEWEEEEDEWSKFDGF